MGGLHTHMGIGGVSLARPTVTKIYFRIGDAVALRFSAGKHGAVTQQGLHYMRRTCVSF